MQHTHVILINGRGKVSAWDFFWRGEGLGSFLLLSFLGFFF